MVVETRRGRRGTYLGWKPKIDFDFGVSSWLIDEVWMMWWKPHSKQMWHGWILFENDQKQPKSFKIARFRSETFGNRSKTFGNVWNWSKNDLKQIQNKIKKQRSQLVTNRWNDCIGQKDQMRSEDDDDENKERLTYRFWEEGIKRDFLFSSLLSVEEFFLNIFSFYRIGSELSSVRVCYREVPFSFYRIGSALKNHIDRSFPLFIIKDQSFIIQ